jgi:FlgD Ig-like domain
LSARSSIAPATLLALSLFAPDSARAAWTANGNLVCSAANDQTNLIMAPDGGGGMFIVWQDDRAGNADLYATRLTSAGSVAAGWPANGYAVCTAAGDQKLPVIAPDGAGGFYLAWEDYRVPGGESDLYLQRVTGSATLAAGWPANGLAVCALAHSQGFPCMIAGTSGAIVAWQDERSGTSTDVYVQRVSGAAAPQWTANGVALCTAAGHQMFPTIASDGADGAIVAWQDARNGNTDIDAQRIGSAGTPLWAAGGVPVCGATDDQLTPRIVADAGGGAIVEWDDDRDFNSDVYTQRLNASGVAQWGADGVALCTDLSEQYSAAIVADGMGGAIVTWTDYRGGGGDLYAQRINASGATQWLANGAVMCDATGEQFDAQAVSDLANGMYLVWADARGGAGASDIYAARVTSSGAIAKGWLANGSLVCNAINAQQRPAVLADGAGCFVAWADERNGVGSGDVYAWRSGSSTSVDVPLPPLAAALGLAPPFPNPARGGVTLRFESSAFGPARLTIVDLAGRHVRSLLDDGDLPGGTHVLSWDGRDEAGALAPAGLYLVVLESLGGHETRKVAIVR